MSVAPSVFDIPPEDADHPDTPCPAIMHDEPAGLGAFSPIRCGVALRWCPSCSGYHHILEEFWVLQHYTRGIIDPEDGTDRFRSDMEKPCSVEEWIEALARVEGK